MIEAAYAAEEAGHGAEHGGGAAGGLPNPMHQFEIKRLIPLELFGFDASFTNSALFMVIAASVITLFTMYAMRGRALVPTRLQSVAELSYEFVANMVRA
ncbi:MAG: F0F1 ATP synthase subunit A, partial [Hyphomicrobiaceae bacterium]